MPLENKMWTQNKTQRESPSLQNYTDVLSPEGQSFSLERRKIKGSTLHTARVSSPDPTKMVVGTQSLGNLWEFPMETKSTWWTIPNSGIEEALLKGWAPSVSIEQRKAWGVGRLLCGLMSSPPLFCPHHPRPSLAPFGRDGIIAQGSIQD